MHYVHCVMFDFYSNQNKDVSGNLLQCLSRGRFGLSVKRATQQTNFDRISCESPRDAKIKVKHYCSMQNTENHGKIAAAAVNV